MDLFLMSTAGLFPRPYENYISRTPDSTRFRKSCIHLYVLYWRQRPMLCVEPGILVVLQI